MADKKQPKAVTPAAKPKDRFNKLCTELAQSKEEVYRDFAAYIAGKKFKAS